MPPIPCKQMAKGKKKRAPVVRLEMRWGGLFSLLLVSFCLMLWMFLFGVWAGQTVLQRYGNDHIRRPLTKEFTGHFSSAERVVKSPVHSHTIAVVPLPAVGQGKVIKHLSAKSVKKNLVSQVGKKNSVASQKGTSDGSFYAIQVGAYQDEARARKAAGQWRLTEQEAFYLHPPAGSRFYRVFVGHIRDLSSAKKKVAAIEDRIKSKVFITLIDGNQKRVSAP